MRLRQVACTIGRMAVHGAWSRKSSRRSLRPIKARRAEPLVRLGTGMAELKQHATLAPPL
jgi:hypothetical protein